MPDNSAIANDSGNDSDLSLAKRLRNSYPDTSSDTTKNKRRVTYACDNCNRLRTRCDGQSPCMHCTKVSAQCTYTRERKRRGRAASQKPKSNANGKSNETKRHKFSSADVDVPPLHPAPPPAINEPTGSSSPQFFTVDSTAPHSQGYPNFATVAHPPDSSSTSALRSTFASASHELNDADSRESESSFPTFSLRQIQPSPGTPIEKYLQSPISRSTWPGSLDLDNRSDQLDVQSTLPISNGSLMEPNNQSSSTGQNMEMTSPRIPNRPHHQDPITIPNIPKEASNNGSESVETNEHHTGSFSMDYPTGDMLYPILQPIANSLGFIPPTLACDLLESYFNSSPHVLAHVLRRSSILHLERPRPTSRALLYSLMMVSAHSSDHPAMTATPTTRQDVINELLGLTVRNLRPYHNPMVMGTVDDVITYIQLGTVTSASEFKGNSLSWWHCAWSLARDLKLNQEFVSLPEEEREERRRIWWLLYCVDRHLGLCYNRSITITDAESMTLFLPTASDELWHSDSELMPPEVDINGRRRKGVTYTPTGRGIFGYFLPLMSILGGLVDIHQLLLHPTIDTSEVVSSMSRQIMVYMQEYEQVLSAWDTSEGGMPLTYYEDAWRLYARQVLNVFQILVRIPWDPITLLNMSDAEYNRNEISESINYAISVADCINKIFDVDPSLKLMPFFFGIYLLQGSFVLLLATDRSVASTPPAIRKACETIVRAHEVCIVTLNTEYQRNFRRIMRGNLESIYEGDRRSASTASPNADSIYLRKKDESRRRRMDLLSLYRWDAGGSGLAV
ncbi:hypothetical protein CANCADRAFT_32411 [Tortispora caseinolytica NRRL Y-17796]|uniref:Zn(2)-C6 fungal-type domain-containing protein n=1 Tax=Tortispora caseinolytica NRRL Y-17796 TaxID=767744 RepID=A0A1E4TB94_9ASCO|nr:hypothetical protein CANCADRAFT_32411 [Tortispora caseinolytica NRRL Y-17796]